MFRPLVEADLPLLLDLWAESWTEVYEDFVPDRTWFAGHIARECANGAVCRLFVGSRDAILGFLLLDPVGGWIEHLCIASRSKGRGIAQALLTEARRLSPDGLTLGVGARNPRAIRFYEREGFQRNGESVSQRSGFPIFLYRWKP